MRYVLLDRVTSLEVGRRLRAVKTFPLTDESLRSRLSFLPCVPVGILIEVMAQAGGVLLSSADPELPGGLVFAKIEKAVFNGPVLPGDRVELEAEVLDPGQEASRLITRMQRDSSELASMTYFLARRGLDDAEGVDPEAFARGHHERGAVLGIRALLQGGDPGGEPS